MRGGKNAYQLVGQRFGRLTVIERRPSAGSGNARWLCRCECGGEIVPVARDLVTGATKSCGCLRREVIWRQTHKRGFSSPKMTLDLHELEETT